MILTICFVGFLVPAIVSAASCPSLTRNLSFGSRGTDVTQLQTFLIEKGDLAAGNSTGYFGRMTETAVKKFQCREMKICSGTPSTTGYGRVGALTRAKIAAVCTPTTANTTVPAPTQDFGNKGGLIPDIQPTNCVFSGKTIASGSSVTAYQNASGTETQCSFKEQRTCQNGILSGGYAYASCAVKANTSTFYRGLEDMFVHFWTGSKTEGNVIPTWTGVVGETLVDPRGGIWHAGTFLDLLYSRYKLQPSEENLAPIRAEWNYIRNKFADNELTSCGASSKQNFASDDTGWNAHTYIQFYELLGEPRALTLAKAAAKCGFDRWGDTALGGGLWYDDSRNTKSLYQTGLVNDAYRLYQITQDPMYISYVRFAVNGINATLRRDDGLYWADYGWWPGENHTTVAPHPLGVERPNDIKLAGSVSFLAGNMGMSLLNERMYRLTGDQAYRTAAHKTATAIAQVYRESNGGILDDRDGWTNAHFVHDWLVEVYPTLPVGTQTMIRAMFEKTAINIGTVDRTADGYYGAAWNGSQPSAWDAIGTIPKQIMTSATALMISAGPHIIDARLPIPPSPPNPSLVPTFPLPALAAVLLGQTGEDMVSPTAATSNGVKDVHIRLSNVPKTISKVHIDSADGAWEYPFNGSNWTILIQSGPVTELYFDFYKQHSSYTVTITFTDGTLATVTAI